MHWSGQVAIVDDDASVRMALERLLRLRGIDCRSYSSAHAFLASLPDGAPVCLIVDVNMPGMTGLDLQRELLKRGVLLPTLVISASDDERVAETAKVLGAQAFLPKPVGPDALMVAISAAVKKRD